MTGIGDIHPVQLGPGPLPTHNPELDFDNASPEELDLWNNGYYFRGGVLKAFESRDHEIIVGGPYETGKSFGLELKFFLQNAKYPNCRSLMIRKRYKDLVGSGVEMLRDNIIKNPWQPYPLGHPMCPVETFGGIDEPKSLKFKNGSIIYFRGFDDPTKVLSAQYDFIYVVQAEELELRDWEELLGRCTGRANNSPYPQVMGDCNPGGSENHWIKQRSKPGGPLKLFEQFHRDNPWLCSVDPEEPENEDKDVYTPAGERTMKVLDGYTGAMRAKALYGLWISPEGVIFKELREDIHVLDGRGFSIPDSWARFRSIDFGMAHPFVCQWWALDEMNVMYLYREIYMSGVNIEDHALHINQLSDGEHYLFTVVDGQAKGDIDTLERHGIWCTLAEKDNVYGLQLVAERLQVFPDGKTSMYFLNNALVEPDTSLAEKFHPYTTFDSLVNLTYKPNLTGSRLDEEPIKKHDDGYDATKYAVIAVDGHVGAGLQAGSFNVSTGVEGDKNRSRKDRGKNRIRRRYRTTR